MEWLTNIPGIQEGEDGANGEEIVILMESHFGGLWSVCVR
jgi:hypothetical protein